MPTIALCHIDKVAMIDDALEELVESESVVPAKCCGEASDGYILPRRAQEVRRSERPWRVPCVLWALLAGNTEVRMDP